MSVTSWDSQKLYCSTCRNKRADYVLAYQTHQQLQTWKNEAKTTTGLLDGDFRFVFVSTMNECMSDQAYLKGEIDFEVYSKWTGYYVIRKYGLKLKCANDTRV